MLRIGALHQQLRDGTVTRHRELEAHPWMRGLVKPSLTLEHYTNVLGAFLAWYRELDLCLERSADVLDASASAIRWIYRPRSPQIERDLARLDASRLEFPAPAIKIEQDASSLIGLLYVIEGSTLGGRLIANRVRATLGPAVPVGHFLPGDGDDWLAFLEVLDTHERVLDTPCLIESACSTFEQIKSHLDACMECAARE